MRGPYLKASTFAFGILVCGARARDAEAKREAGVRFPARNVNSVAPSATTHDFQGSVGTGFRF